MDLGSRGCKTLVVTLYPYHSGDYVDVNYYFHYKKQLIESFAVSSKLNYSRSHELSELGTASSIKFPFS